VAHNVLYRLAVQHLFVQVNFVIELLVCLLHKVVDKRDLWRGKLDHELGGHRWHQAARKGQLRQIYKFGLGHLPLI